MDPPTAGREPRPPSHVSAAATCHTLPGLGSVMERSLSVGEGEGIRGLYREEVTPEVRSSLGPDLKVWSGSLKKGMHGPAPSARSLLGPPLPQARRLQFGEGKGRQLGRKSCSPPKNLLIRSSRRSVSCVGMCLLSPQNHRWCPSERFLLWAACCLSALCQRVRWVFRSEGPAFDHPIQGGEMNLLTKVMPFVATKKCPQLGRHFRGGTLIWHS